MSTKGSSKQISIQAIQAGLAVSAVFWCTGCVLEKTPNAAATGIRPAQKGVVVARDPLLTAVQQILGAHCYDCHSTYRNIGIDPGLTASLVAPGKPLESVLFASLAGSGGASSVTPYANSMPTGEAAIPDLELKTIQSWIEQYTGPSASDNWLITSPAQGSNASGSVQIVGQAGSRWRSVAALDSQGTQLAEGAIAGGAFIVVVDTTTIPDGTEKLRIVASSLPTGQTGGANTEADLTLNIQNGTVTPPSPTPSATPAASTPASRLAAMKTVINANCVSCHSDFKYATDAEWVAAGLAKPGDLAGSLLFARLMGNGVTTAKADMPYFQLGAAQLKSIKDWVLGLSTTTPTPTPTPTPAPSVKPSPTPTASPSSTPSGLTFAKDVQPILNAKCTSCHNGSADFSLKTQADVMKKVKTGSATGSLLYTTLLSPSGKMFKLGISTTTTEQKTIADWINQGAK